MPFEIDGTGELIVDESISSDKLMLRSEEVSEIISSRPSFLVRWGISIFFLILICIVVTCWFIQYPDIVTTKAKLTSINAPKEVKAKTDGKLIRLTVSEEQHVKKDEILGYMESRANHEEVIALSELVDTLQVRLNANQVGAVLSVKPDPYLHLGEVQQQYQVVIQALNVFKQYLSSGYYVRKKGMLQKDFKFLESLNANLAMQRNMQQEDLALQQETFKANEYLNKEKVISASEYRTEKSKLIGKELSVPQITSAMIANESGKHEKQKEIMELDNQVAQQKEIFVQALNTFKAQLDDWKSRYLLISPVDGKVSFATFLEENQQLQNNQVICYINPGNSAYYAIIHIPQTNLGKIKKQQKVLLQFPSYPYQEFGKLEGSLAFISNIPTDSGYVAKVDLPKGLITNYKQQIQFREGLTAQAEIITADMNLLERLFNGMKGIIKN